METAVEKNYSDYFVPDSFNIKVIVDAIGKLISVSPGKEKNNYAFCCRINYNRGLVRTVMLNFLHKTRLIVDTPAK